MARHARPRPSRKSRNSAVAVVTAGAATLTFAALRGPSSLTSTASAATSGSPVDASRMLATSSDAAVASLSRQSSAALQQAHAQAAEQARDAERTRKQHEQAERKRAAAERADRAKRAAAKRAATTHTAHPTTAAHPKTAAKTSRPAASSTPAPDPAPTTTASSAASSTAYADNLDGWIKQALAVMAEHGIPGTYDGIYRNIMRESSGDPNAVNNWDSNAAAGTPSKGLLQVIQPTFDTYHVAGTSMDIMDPVANIVAACNYAAAMYGSIDNVYSAY